MKNQNIFSLSDWNNDVSDVGQAVPNQILVSVGDVAVESASLMLNLKHVNGLRFVKLSGEPIIQYNDFNIDSQIKSTFENHEFLPAMSKHHIDYAYFHNVKEGSYLYAWLKDKAMITATKLAPYIDLTDINSLDDYYRLLSASTRKSRRRAAKKLAANFEVEFATFIDADIEASLIDKVLNLKKQQLDKSGMSSRLFSSPRKLEQLKNIILSHDRSFKCIISVLKCDGKIAAAELGYLYDGVYYSFLGTMDDAYQAYGPGTCQLLKTIEWAISAEVKIFDLLPPEDAYKFSWTRENSETVYDILLPFTLKGRLFGYIYYARLRPWLKQFYFWYKKRKN